MANVYKYFSPTLLSVAFCRPGYVGLKCSLPQDYNDPYELFLGADLGVGSDELATYRDIIQELPQLQTTCFSRSPVVSPMWAHYANNHTGFLLEFDRDFLRDNYPEAGLRDVTYRPGPSTDIEKFVQRAAFRAKPRDAYFLQSFVLQQAYFSKYEEWAYEQECRLVGLDHYVEKINDIEILFVPMDGLTSLVVGSRASKDLVKASREVSEQNELSWYKANIGKSYSRPFLTDATDQVFVYDEGAIRPPINTCDNCGEPQIDRNELCPWCSITEDDQLAAAGRNPFRILDHYGALEDYIRGADEVGRSRRR